MRRILQGLFLALLGGIVIAACTDTAGPPRSTQSSSGTLNARSVMEFTDVEVSGLPPEFVAALEAKGWVRAADGFERREHLHEFSVKSGGRTSSVGEDGEFLAASANDLVVQYQGYDLNPAIAPLTCEVRDGRVTLVLTLSVSSHLARRSHEHGKVDDPDVTSHLPCLDYNGPWGNQRPNQPGYQGIVNFNGSDCWSAWPVCMVRDFTWWPYCNGHRNCSGLIGHCGTYHRHTYPGGPSC